jgi:pimeloyl-ACP methyl ester carboxylesterase
MTEDLPAGVERDIITMEAPGVTRAGAGGYPLQGFYTRPAGTMPKVALIATHYNVDFSEHYLSALMAQRGYGFLGWNTRFRGADHFFALDRALVDIGQGVAWLRAHGAETVVLLGNSGGGSLMAAYHAQCQGDVITSSFGIPLLPEVHQLPAGDLYVSLAAHPGRPEVLTGWLDPSVTDETDPTSVDPELDMYADGREPPFDPEFVRRYRDGQRARNQRVTDWAKAELARLNAAGVPDRLFLLPRTWADLRFVDATLDPSERPVPYCYRGDPRAANRGVTGVGAINTLRSWLSMWSLETSQARSELHLAALTIPALVIQATADSGVFPSDADTIYAQIAAPDKTRLDIKGEHYFRDRPDGRDEVASAIADWIAPRRG